MEGMPGNALRTIIHVTNGTWDKGVVTTVTIAKPHVQLAGNAWYLKDGTTNSVTGIQENISREPSTPSPHHEHVANAHPR
jgi:hypothetical protein